MFRLRGDRQSLLAALAIQWVDQQLGIPAREVTTALAPVQAHAPMSLPKRS
jgi:hypothetical protein